MRITYDREVDAVYISLKDRAQVTTTKQVTGDINLNFEGDRLAGIEILAASLVLADPTFVNAAIVEQIARNSAADPKAR